MFFFALGAGFDLSVLATVAIPAIALALVMLTLKPLVFKALLDWEGEQPRLGREIGVRLGQVSEFSLLIALLAVSGGVIGAQASFLIQATTLLTSTTMKEPVSISARMTRRILPSVWL